MGSQLQHQPIQIPNKPSTFPPKAFCSGCGEQCRSLSGTKKRLSVSVLEVPMVLGDQKCVIDNHEVKFSGSAMVAGSCGSF